MADEKLREVAYWLRPKYEGYDPDATQEGIAQAEEERKERRGWFHGWTDVEQPDSSYVNPIYKKEALIETEEGGSITLPNDNFRFVNNPETNG